MALVLADIEAPASSTHYVQASQSPQGGAARIAVMVPSPHIVITIRSENQLQILQMRLYDGWDIPG